MRADWDGHPNGSEWSSHVEMALGISQLPGFVPADVQQFWSGYEAADPAGRQEFWLMLISAIAKEESNFDPNCEYDEPPPLNQKSLGLMQLSYTDRSYGCDFPDEQSVKDPRRNLTCAVRIMNRLILRDQRIGGDGAHRTAGAAAYWSTLRVPRPGNRDPRAYVISRTSVL